jgi:hypothetical protein
MLTPNVTGTITRANAADLGIATQYGISSIWAELKNRIHFFYDSVWGKTGSYFMELGFRAQFLRADRSSMGHNLFQDRL